MKIPKADPSSFVLEQEQEFRGPRHLTSSQARAHRQLADLVELIGHDNDYGGFRVRVMPLLCGPSGAGKSAVVSRLCDSLSTPDRPFPLFPINSGAWILAASRGSECGTLKVIRDFVRQNERGIVFLDEIDKAVPTEAWKDGYSTSIVGECLALLDRDARLLTAGWVDRDIKRFRNSVVIGAGAWMRMAEIDSASHRAAIERDPGIPLEIFRRFGHVIYVGPPDYQDFVAAYQRLYTDLDLPMLSGAELKKLAAAAVESNLGMRQMERHLTDLLCAYPQLRRPSKSVDSASSVAAASEESITIVSSGLYDRYRQEVSRLMEELEAPLAHLQVLFRLHEPSFARVCVECPDETSQEALSPGDLDNLFTDLIEALHFFYSLEHDWRETRRKYISIQGDRLLNVVRNGLQLNAAFLEEKGQLALFTSTSVKLSRFLAVWRHFTTLRPEEA